MQNISNLLNKNRFQISSEPKRNLNLNYEEAKEFGQYIGLNTILVLKLFKNYGKQKVLNLRSWAKDVPFDQRKGLMGLLVWKLKEN